MDYHASMKVGRQQLAGIIGEAETNAITHKPKIAI